MNSTLNLVHPDWEFEDPTPNIQTLFQKFDARFFSGRLVSVELEWSKKMYSCAGICYSRRNNYGMSCTIRLSEPLLKLRSRKELVETLLHEMIHAFLFVLGIREGNGGHGPNFCKMMNNINKSAGTNITVYHNFHDEVRSYKTHWWRCDGVCQDRGPFFGYVKRTCNRAPSKNDLWWAQHLQTCGGTFIKVKEPDSKRKKAGDKENVKKISSKGTSPDIRKYFPTNSRSSFTLDKEKNTGIDRIASTSISHSPSSNIHELKSQNNIDSPVGSHQLNQLFSGSGVTLGGTRKRSRLLDENENSSRNSKQAKISQISSEVIVVRTLSDDENGIIPMSSQEIIKQELEDEFDDDVILIDDEFDDSVGPTELVDTSIIDGIFEGDQHDFKSKTYLSDSMPSTSTATASGISPNSKSQLEKAGYSQTEINAMNDVSIPLPLVCCPVCNTRLQEIEINVHLDSCLNSFQV